MILIEQLVPRIDFPIVVHDMKIWDMDAESVTPAHLHGFNYRAKNRIDHTDAKSMVERIADAISIADECGQIKNSKFKSFSIKEPPMLSGEFRLNLELLSLEERRCAYFALLSNMTLENSISLTWSDVNVLRSNDLIQDCSLDIVDSMVRHLRFPYVFWETIDSSPVRLHNLRANLEIAFGCSFEALQEKFNSMVLTDPQIYSKELEKHFSRREL